MFGGKTPDITPAQITAVVTFIVGQAVAWGLVSNNREQTLISAGSTLIAIAWKIADAHIRHGRAVGNVHALPQVTAAKRKPAAR